jgi:hypothetical protein
MPESDDTPAIFFCKLSGSRQFPRLEPMGFPNIHFIFHVEDRFPVTFPHVDVDGAMIVTVEEKAKAFLLENLRHGG